MKWLIAVVVLTACDRRPPLASCSDDLHGVWRAPSGRWALLDHGTTLEAFALVDDSERTTRAGDTLGAPRVIDIAREPAATATLAGEIKRRYTRGGDHCEARAPIRVTKCEGSELQLVLADPQPPLGFAPCTWGSAPPSRVERWRRE